MWVTRGLSYHALLFSPAFLRMHKSFRLTRHFTLTSLLAFLVVGATLLYFEQRRAEIFQGVQKREAQTLRDIQSEFAKQAYDSSRRDLLNINEQGNVNLTRLFSNALWPTDFSAFMAEVARIDFARCRGMADINDEDGKSRPPPEKSACFKQVGLQIPALEGFAALDQRVRAAMKGSTVFKVKVYDLQGITVYSTEHAQIGEDKSTSAGWQGAARAGRSVSELTFRDKFSALQGIVVNRDLIASYLPVIDPINDSIVGVFEIYSDVTPFLQSIKATTAKFQEAAEINQQRLDEQARSSEDQLQSSARNQVLILGAALALLYLVLLAIVRRAQTTLDNQAREVEANRQRMAQSEKMNSLGQMVAGVVHQLNTPLAFSRNNVQMSLEGIDGLTSAMEPLTRNSTTARDPAVGRMVSDLHETKAMLADVMMGLKQMDELVDHLRGFSRLDRSATSDADLNEALASVCYIAKSVISTKIEIVREFGELPRLQCNVSQLNQVFLNLIMNAAQAIEGSGRIRVTSAWDGEWIRVTVVDSGKGIPANVLPRIFDSYFTTKPKGEGTGLGLAIARDIVEQHAGTISVKSRVGVGTEFVVQLPLRPEVDAA